MRNPLHTSFGAVFQNEILLNSKRVAPYALMILFTAHSVLWWGWSIAAHYGWSTNSDYNIVRNLQGFSFILGLPIFNAVIMGDPVIRDFRTGIDPLIFSKPVGRAAYLLGKFCGNFFVLVCCQSTFMLTMLLMQWFPSSRVIVGPIQVLPYFKHFFFFVVISHLFLAAVYFTAGTLTRNAKIVYGLAGAFYPLYISYQLFLLKNLPERWRSIPDPFALRTQSIPVDKWQDAAWINQLVVVYRADMIANRALMILLTVVCLTILYFRFTIGERSSQGAFSVLNLSTRVETLDSDSDSFPLTAGEHFEELDSGKRAIPAVTLPGVNRANAGLLTNLNKLFASLWVEFQLLRTEKSLIVLIPLSMLLSFLSLPFSAAVSGVSYSAAYASTTASSLLLFLLGVIVFYTGEAMHRDREMKVEPVLWTVPAPNSVLLLSKYLTTFLLTLSLAVIIGLTAIVTQLLRSHTPVEISAYLITYFVILLPSIALMAGVSIALNVSLRNKYLVYAVSIATASGLFYLYSLGYNHWFYNPVLYQLWDYPDLIGGANQSRILWHRAYCLGLVGLFLSVAHLLYPRNSVRKPRLISPGAPALIALISAIAAILAASRI